MRLLSLALLNFKGIKLFQLETNQGENVSIFGDNGTGKTTICDALYYLLFDKDSSFKKQFEIKTLDKQGNPLPGLDHDVEGVFITDSGEYLTLKKSYKEIWTKKRGQAQKTFTGHKTDYYIDEIPVKKNEFQKRASEYFVEETFKLLTTPSYFSETLPWKDRRNLLLEICGDISDEDVIKSDKDLSGLKAVLCDRSIDDHKKVIADKKSKLNEEIKQIPVRIDEATRSIEGADFIDVDFEKSEFEKVKAQISEKESHINRIESGGEITEQQKRLSELETLENNIKNDLNVKHRDRVYEHRNRKDDAQTSLDRINNEIAIIEHDIRNIEMKNSYYVDEVNRLRDFWHTKNNMQFRPPENPENCPVCGQVIPEEDRTEIEEKALEQFNVKKSEEIEKVNLEGTEAAKKVDHAEAEIKEKHKERDSLIKKKVDAEKLLSEMSEKLEAVLNETIEPADELLKVQADIKVVKETIYNIKSGLDNQTTGIREELEFLTGKRIEIEKNLSSYEASLKTKERIKNLENQERTLAAEIEELESQLFMIEKIIMSKVHLLESNINSKFKLAKFKLFKTQINGGVDECCEVTMNGVPFSSGLNNGARINVGLDIIETLSEHFNTTAPIFIDNAESVTEINTPENSQVIKMVVSQDDKKLRVETE